MTETKEELEPAVLAPVQAAAVVADLAARGSVLVAYSGGVDSALVAALAVRAVGERALAVTAAAETLAGAELDHARRLAAEIGIRHQVITYSELDDPEFAANPAHRCYVCQGMRMDAMRREARRLGLAVVCDGTNASDPGPDRPGLRAVRERGIHSPLLAHGIDKPAARAMARWLGLSAWDRPANACLSSRIPHGQVVTLGKLRRIEAAEALLTGDGFRIVRVRDDHGGARVEVAAGEVERLASSWQDLAPRLRDLGFERAAFDPRGYRRGGADWPPAESVESVAAPASPSTDPAADPAAASPAAPPPAPWRP
ncbi:MAG TPA: ATP-dependent sacrificial sulfur transferase LarE [Thermoanaerobaculia bacterium]